MLTDSMLDCLEVVVPTRKESSENLHSDMRQSK